MEMENFEIKGFDSVSDIIEMFGESFNFPKLIGLSYLVFPSAPTSNVNVTLYDDQDGPSESRVTLIVNRVRCHPNGGADHVGMLRFMWTTGSGHVVHIDGDWREEDYFYSFEKGEEPTFTIWLGEDESERFYPRVKELIQEVSASNENTDKTPTQ